MTDNIITFPTIQRRISDRVPAEHSVREADAPSRTHKKHPPRDHPKKHADGRRKSVGISRSIEPNIQEIPGKNGNASYRVQIRKKVDGKSHSFTETFADLRMARKWKKKKLAEIELNGVREVLRTEETVGDAITARLKKGRSLGRSATQQLNWLAKSEFALNKLTDLHEGSLSDFADDMLAEERRPQTVAGYLTVLVSTLDWAARRGFSLPIATLRQSMDVLWEDEVLARSEERNRRPSRDELDRILDAVNQNKRQQIPLVKLIVFAIFSSRRLGEICRLRWEDLRIDNKKILVRDMKHPRKKNGNDVWCALTDEALAIIQSMPKEGEFIFPFNERSVGTAWRRHRDRAGVKDLRFHDLRHEAVSRLFEMGMSATFVAKHSGHKNGGCLYRYEHAECEGDKFEGWAWTAYAAQPHGSEEK